MQPIVFLHIPRTGGTTLRAVLDSVYGRKNCVNLPDFPDAEMVRARLDKFTAKRNRPPAVLSGHMNFGTVSGRYVTLLRDPVERTISAYSFARSRGYKVAHTLDGDPVPLEEFIIPDRRGHGVVNMQAKMIAGIYAPVRRQWDFQPVPGERQAENLLDKALANLRRMTVGVTDAYGRSLARFCESFSWPAVEAGVSNAAPRQSDEIAMSTRKRIEEINAVDMEIYELARSQS